MQEVICINGKFQPVDELYFTKHCISKPLEDKIYTIREIVQNTVGEKGLLLVEIVNKPSPKTSPFTGMKGFAEQNWAISRFTTLLGEPVLAEKTSISIHDNS